MRLDVRDGDALLHRDLGQRAHLVGHLLGQQVRGHVPGHPAEVLPVGVGHLRTHRHAQPGRLGAHAAHGHGGAGVVAAGDVRAGHEREQGGVVGDLLTQVGIEVHLSHRENVSPRRPPGTPEKSLRVRWHGNSRRLLTRLFW